MQTPDGSTALASWEQRWNKDFLDKTNWGTGPWSTEPDRIEWWDKATGYACVMVRHRIQGHWRAYVGLPPRHPRFGYDVTHFKDVVVHDGIAYANHHLPPDVTAVRSPATPRMASSFWVGFSCGIGGVDFMPALNALLDPPPRTPAESGETYRDVDFVREQVERLCRQLAALPK